MVLVKEVIQGKYCCGWIVVEGNPHAELKNKTKNYFEAQKEKAKTKTNKVAAESQKKSESKNKASSAGLGKKRTKIEPPNCRKNKQMSKCRSKLKS